MVKELGDKIAVQTSDWNCSNIVTTNHPRKPFDDVRVRKALALAFDHDELIKNLRRGVDQAVANGEAHQPSHVMYAQFAH